MVGPLAIVIIFITMAKGLKPLIGQTKCVLQDIEDITV